MRPKGAKLLFQTSIALVIGPDLEPGFKVKLIASWSSNYLSGSFRGLWGYVRSLGERVNCFSPFNENHTTFECFICCGSTEKLQLEKRTKRIPVLKCMYFKKLVTVSYSLWLNYFPCSSYLTVVWSSKLCALHTFLLKLVK